MTEPVGRIKGIVMKHTRPSVFSKFFAVFFFVFAFAQGVFAQQSNPLAYLEQTFPKLTELYRSDLNKYPAHYIFVVDVSGTMDKYENDVVSALRPFFEALPNNDRVDVIPFGSSALDGMLQYQGVINDEVKRTLCANLSNFYHDPSYPQGFKSATYVKAAVQSVAKVMQNNRDYKINIVVMLTDFWNEDPVSRTFTEDELSQMHDAIGAASNNIYTRTIALQLPINPKATGNVLPQLRESVFQDMERGLEIVPMGQSGDMIRQWFEQLRREIMVDKLRAIISTANKTNPVHMAIEINIDGKTKAEIHWTPSKLYPMMKIDSTFVGQKGFYFVNKKENFQTTRDSVIGVDPELMLGQLKHESFFFHHIQDSLHLGIDLPTDYDDELIALGVKKPLPATTQAIDKWVFTFFLPFWLFCTIIALIILYILGVINAMRRNSKLCFKGNVTVYDEQGNQIDDVRRVSKQAPSAVLTFGAGGSPNCRVDDAEWAFVVEKKKGNPFLLFVKPCFTWRKTKGYVAAGKAQSGKFGPDGPTMVRVKCGLSRSEETHSVKIQLKS